MNEITEIKTAPDAIKYLDSILNDIHTQLTHHEFDCVMAYIKEKYQL